MGDSAAVWYVEMLQGPGAQDYRILGPQEWGKIVRSLGGRWMRDAPERGCRELGMSRGDAPSSPSAADETSPLRGRWPTNLVTAAGDKALNGRAAHYWCGLAEEPGGRGGELTPRPTNQATAVVSCNSIGTRALVCVHVPPRRRRRLNGFASSATLVCMHSPGLENPQTYGVRPQGGVVRGSGSDARLPAAAPVSSARAAWPEPGWPKGGSERRELGRSKHDRHKPRQLPQAIQQSVKMWSFR